MKLATSAELLIRIASGPRDFVDPSFQNQRLYRYLHTKASKTDSPRLRIATTTALNLLAFGPLFIFIAAIGLGLANVAPVRATLDGLGATLFVIFDIWAIRMLIKWAFRPTSLGLSRDGIRLYAGNDLCALEFIDWQLLQRVRLIEHEKTSKKTNGISIGFTQVNGKSTSIDLADIRTIEERRALVESLKTNARHAIEGADIGRILRASAVQDIPFTQLWSHALRSDIARSNAGALPLRTLLQDGRIEVEERIGGGGQGVVYRANLLELGSEPRVVALKEYVLPDLEHIFDRKRAVEQFEREVHLLARVKHSGLVQLLDAFVEDHRAYLVMEYLGGSSLRDRIRKEGRLSDVEACKTALAICAVLEYLHNLTPPAVHLDVTPENLVYDGAGHLKLIDFNTSSDGSGVRTKLIAGKQRYMPPEQYRNEVSPQCDIYALGCTLFLILTGVEPEPLCVSQPKQFNAAVSDTLDELVARCTSLEVAERPASALLVASELNSFLSSQNL
jgi:tRNA A-37 threonylcarbamoyl transferase component Bud32